MIYNLRMKNIPQARIRAASEGLHAIANEIRLTILCHLMDGSKSAQELIKITGASQSNLSQHLAKMRMLGILVNERRGQQMFYHIANAGFADLVDALCCIYCPEICPPRRQKKT